jgi:prefoldin beta subunit
MKQEVQEKINQLQSWEQNINSLIAQKQQFQAQNMEIENAMEQIKGSEKTFRIIGNIMVASPKDTVKKDLDEKKEIIELRLKNLDKQEQKLRDKASELQQEILKEMKSDKNA